jgi:hypothetical protein
MRAWRFPEKLTAEAITEAIRLAKEALVSTTAIAHRPA